MPKEGRNKKGGAAPTPKELSASGNALESELEKPAKFGWRSFRRKKQGETASTKKEEMKRSPSLTPSPSSGPLDTKRGKSTKEVLLEQLGTYQNERANAISQGDALKKAEFSALVAEVKLEIALFDLKDPPNEEAKARALDAHREARQAQRQAEYDRRKAEHDQQVAVLERKIAEAKSDANNPSLAKKFRDIAEEDWAKFRKRLNDLKWDEEDERAKIAERFPDHPDARTTGLALVDMNWSNVSETLSNLRFRVNEILDDEDSQRAVLGPLFKPGFSWPVVVTSSSHTRTIDMRLMSRKVFDPDGDELRPAARELSNRLREGGLGTLALIAVPGIGKSSALIDLGREHYVIYIQSSTKSNIKGIGAMSRLSREFDQNFVDMIQDLAAATSVENLVEVKQRNWDMTVRRTMVELVARVLQLVRMRRDLGSQLTCWSFAAHQLAGEQEFVTRMVKLLKQASETALENILQASMEELAEIFSPSCRFVVAIDEMELAAHELKERFMRPTNEEVDATSSTVNDPKGILSPLVRAVSDLAHIAGWSLVLAGTGASEESVMRLKTDVGKLHISKIISGAPKFPLTQPSDVLGLLHRLNLSENLRAALSEGLQSSPLHVSSRDVKSAVSQPNALKIKYDLEDYVVPARFRILCAIFEHIRKHLGSSEDPDVLLLNATRSSIDQHRDGLQNLLLVRLNPGHPYGLPSAIVEAYLSYLMQVLVTVRLTDGRTSFIDSAIIDPRIRDLTRLGIAAAANTGIISLPAGDPRTEPTSYTAYTVCERFVVDVLEQLFARDDITDKVQQAQLSGILSMLRNVLGTFGPAVAFKGNIIEKMILERLVVLGKTFTNVTDLPFFPVRHADASWSAWEFLPTHLEQYNPKRSTPAFLSSDPAHSVVYSPETVCRPDGIVMLRKQGPENHERRAISVGVAVYTQRVPKDKVDSQIWSTDLSRAYLNSSQMVYDATRARRREWVTNQLHKTVALRVHVYLPYAPAADEMFQFQTHKREMAEFPSSPPQPMVEGTVPISELDLIVNIDRSNIHQLLGAPGDSENTAQLYTLLKFATGVDSGWSV